MIIYKAIVEYKKNESLPYKEPFVIGFVSLIALKAL